MSPVAFHRPLTVTIGGETYEAESFEVEHGLGSGGAQVTATVYSDRDLVGTGGFMDVKATDSNGIAEAKNALCVNATDYGNGTYTLTFEAEAIWYRKETDGEKLRRMFAEARRCAS